MAAPLSPLARTLRDLRKRRGWSLRQVELATDSFVSNVYLSQLENDRRSDPGPRVLMALAKVYGVPTQFLFERAGYVEAPEPSAVEVAYQQVLADPTFKFGTRASDVDENAKRFIIELYEKATGKRLLQEG